MILSAKVNRRIGKAMDDYSMLSQGDRVLVAVSGGVDSLFLIHLLMHWQKKCPVQYELVPVHVDLGIWKEGDDGENPAATVKALIEKMGLVLHVEKNPDLLQQSRTCFHCSKLRRKLLFDLASRFKCNKIAFGHHKDDLLETFFLNLLYSGNVSTMVPRQELFNGSLTVIRPLAYIEKKEIEDYAARAGIHAVPNLCPLAGETRREEVQSILQGIYEKVPGAKNSLFAAMGNVREEYLL